MSSTDPAQLVGVLGAAVRYTLGKARREGRSLTLVSGLRTREQQVSLRRAHCGESAFDIYEKKAADCSPPTARPGTSKHETGQAADLGGDLEWAARVMAPFGIGRPVAGENWHFEFTGADPEAAFRVLGRAVASELVTAQERTSIVGRIDAATTVDIPGLGPVNLSPLGLVAAAGEAAGAGIAQIPGADALAAVSHVAGRLIDPAWWRRVGLGAVGVALVGVGLVLVARDSIGSAAATLTPVGKVLP